MKLVVSNIHFLFLFHSFNFKPTLRFSGESVIYGIENHGFIGSVQKDLLNELDYTKGSL